ncbi:glycosyltransferase [Candidatus Woesebacteria bacterium]|nr:glycosyltransferase [Candidatus Woesebacteria bacterium]
MNRHKNYQLLHLNTDSQGGEKKVTDAFLTTCKQLFKKVSVYEVSPPKAAYYVDAIKNISLLLNISNSFFHFHPSSSLKTILYSSHSFAIIPGIFLKMTGRVSSFWFHYHGTKIAKYSAEYRNPFKKLVSFICFHLISAVQHITEYAAINFCDVLIAPNQSTLKKINSKSKKTYVIPSFFDEKIFLPTKVTRTNSLNKENLINIGFIGRIAPEKGILPLLEACKLAKASIKSIHVTVQSNYNQQLFSKIAAYKKLLPLQLHADPNQQDVAQILKKLDCVFLPSQSEHFPLVMLESLASGVPFFATRVGNCPEILSSINSQLLLSSGNAVEISRKIQWLCSLSHSELDKIKRRSIRVASQYTLSRFTKEVCQFVDKQLASDQKING